MRLSAPAWSRRAPSPSDLVDASRAVAVAFAASRCARDAALTIARYDDGPDDPNGLWYVRALARWARQVRHVREPSEIGEIVMTPATTIQRNAGDCDDVAVAVAALAVTVGMSSRLRWASVGRSAHIVAEVLPGWYAPAGPWLTIDQLSDGEALAIGL